MEVSHNLGKLEEFCKPRRFKIEGKSIAVWIHKGEAYAIDANCYHSSGRLDEHTEDIEDINNEPCIRCPIHKYVISLATGHSFYQPIKVNKSCDGNISIEKLDWRSKGYKQRIHHAYIKNGNVYVVINKDSNAVESDKYNKMAQFIGNY